MESRILVSPLIWSRLTLNVCRSLHRKSDIAASVSLANVVMLPSIEILDCVELLTHIILSWAEVLSCSEVLSQVKARSVVKSLCCNEVLRRDETWSGIEVLTWIVTPYAVVVGCSGVVHIRVVVLVGVGFMHVVLEGKFFKLDVIYCPIRAFFLELLDPVTHYLINHVSHFIFL